MKKRNSIKKKLLSIMLLIATMLGVVQPIFAMSTSGTAKWVARTMGFRSFYNR